MGQGRKRRRLRMREEWMKKEKKIKNERRICEGRKRRRLRMREEWMKKEKNIKNAKVKVF